MGVDAGILMRTKFVREAREQLRQRLLLHREQLEQHQPGEDPISLWHVPRKADAAALLEAEQHVALDHLRANVLEPHAGLDQLQSILRAHLIDHRRGSKSFYNPASFLAIHDKMVEKQTND